MYPTLAGLRSESSPEIPMCSSCVAARLQAGVATNTGTVGPQPTGIVPKMAQRPGTRFNGFVGLEHLRRVLAQSKRSYSFSLMEAGASGDHKQ